MIEQPPPHGPTGSDRADRPLGGPGRALIRAGVLGVLAALLWATAPVGGPAGRAPSVFDHAVVLTADPGGYTPTPPQPVRPQQAPAYTPPTYSPPPTHSQPTYTPPTYTRPTYTAPRYTQPTQAPRPANPQPAPHYQHTAPAYPGTQPGYPHAQPGYPAPRPRPEHPRPTQSNPAPSYPTYPRPTSVRPTPAQPPPVLISPLPAPTPVHPLSTPAYPPPGTQFVTVPRVIGLGLYVAEDRLRASGLVVGSVSVTHSADIPGAVVQQSPKDGTSVQTGTTVDLVVAQP